MPTVVTRSLGGGELARSESVDYFPDNGTLVNPTWRWPGPTVEGYTLLRTATVSTEGREPDFEAYTPNTFKGSRHRWNNFSHYKRETVTNPSMNRVRVISGQWVNEPAFHTGHTDLPLFGYRASVYGDAGLLNAGLLPLYAPQSDGNFVLPPDNFEQLKQMSLDTMLPRIKAELSLPNALYELKDFKTLPRQLGQWWSRYNSLFGFVPSKERVRRTLSNLSRSGSEGYLQAKFNVLPLLSDISGLRAALQRSSKQIAAFITRSGRVQNKHFAYNWAELADVDDATDWYSTLSGGRLVRLKRRTTSDSSSFHAQIKYNYNYTQYQLAHAQVLAWLDALGINLNPQIIWNAIPWSFVVDWVAGVSRFLQQFQTQNMTPTINIHQYLWSIKRGRDVIASREFAPIYAANAKWGEVSNMPIIRETAYRRQVGMVDLSSVVLSGLSSTEVSLGAALVIAQRRRRS